MRLPGPHQMATEQFSAPALDSEALHSGIPLTFLKYLQGQSSHRLLTSSPAAPGPASLVKGPGLKSVINERSGLSRKKATAERLLSLGFRQTLPTHYCSGELVGTRVYAGTHTCACVHTRHTRSQTCPTHHARFTTLSVSLWALPSHRVTL